MLKTIVAVSALATASTATFDTADARRGDGWHGPRHHGHSWHRHWRGPRVYLGAPVIYRSYSYGYGYGDGCGWLRQRALYTGSPYWWHRWRACRWG